MFTLFFLSCFRKNMDESDCQHLCDMVASLYTRCFFKCFVKEQNIPSVVISYRSTVTYVRHLRPPKLNTFNAATRSCRQVFLCFLSFSLRKHFSVEPLMPCCFLSALGKITLSTHSLFDRNLEREPSKHTHTRSHSPFHFYTFSKIIVFPPL